VVQRKVHHTGFLIHLFQQGSAVGARQFRITGKAQWAMSQRQRWPMLLILTLMPLFATTETSAKAVPEIQKPDMHQDIKLRDANNQRRWALYRQFPQFEMHKRDTKIGTRSVLEIQAQFTYNGSLSAFFRVLRDTEHAGNWLDSAKSVSIIASPTPFEDSVHTTFETPWPLQQRDMVTCSRWQQAADYSIEMHIVGCTGQWPVPAKTVRIEQVVAQWTLKPLADHRVQVLYTGTADAGGGLPRWLGDPVALASSLRSFRALQQQLALPFYQQPVDEVCEPLFTNEGQVTAAAETSACGALLQRLKP
ncbi:MAG: hypothetical protein KKA56_14200, partial [Gammaproteobacteria bacterium]|nr:hypothetical protein [Gammaproteobacteria bacterium]